MMEAQDDLNIFKAAHLPIEGNWDEIFIEYREQDDVEMAPVGNNDVEMMDLVEPEEPLEPEEPEDLVQDMVCTQNQEDPESSQQGANAEPSLAKVLTAALNRQQNNSELLHRLVDIMSHLAGRGGNNNQPRQSTYSDFLGTHPPTFERAKEPLDADHWLHQTESKFGLLECTERQKVLFAAQQLQGSASA
ncbi:hypothetical protein PR202_gb07900 [Eleusine coracana subsp. coracana]|uniref:Uncharacterized protein n=1 Tax=Eleusine coracana subsp. coracana TaxID=191504 RepID=A0AAV5EDH0_ELECO|nr:hypothetical protein PR202_gb07900 [Eleusine coracana subsp. coracana]